ncbi:hypothetical protein [Bradyrhizobium sp. 174]|uniref:hypothetical protein n=1 Tax=Bradyrhizobium sp. 174 TaxID=2782645 RepID=UPI001FF7C78C|nr:hypothetical protein [Bradyrhizobium sp. 174]MCK1570115.1 hypothetical protein [Bradyrhizobium sp. 174]
MSEKALRILFLGGTGYIGPHYVEGTSSPRSQDLHFGRTLILRLGHIVGPGDWYGGFTYWLDRMGMGVSAMVAVSPRCLSKSRDVADKDYPCRPLAETIKDTRLWHNGLSSDEKAGLLAGFRPLANWKKEWLPAKSWSTYLPEKPRFSPLGDPVD